MSKKKQNKKGSSPLGAILLEKRLRIFVYHSGVLPVGFLNGCHVIVQVDQIGLRINPRSHRQALHALRLKWSR